MSHVSWKLLLGLYLVVGGIATVALRWLQMRGTDPFAVPISVTIVLALIAGTVAFLGFRVRRWVQLGEHFDAIGATRTLALGQAASLVGAMQAGYFTAQIITVFDALPAPEARSVTVAAAIALVAAAALIAAGLVTQWCCRVPPEDDENNNSASTG